MQNEHECLSDAFQSIRQIHQEGGFMASVLGREVNIKIWVHYFIGDTEGNNKWHVKFIDPIVIVSVTLIICQIQIQRVSIQH